MPPSVQVLEIAARAVDAFYEAALWGLRRLDDAGVPPRRFDAEAEARWKQFQGSLTTAHRVDVLLRDGSARFGPAFHAATVFGLSGLPVDEPFGPYWHSLKPQRALDLWNEVRRAPALAPEALVERWAALLGVARPPDGAALPRPGGAEQAMAFGGTAVWRLFRAFRGERGLDWSSAVTVLAATPAERQFAGLLAVVDPAPGATRLIDPPAGDDPGTPEPWAAAVRAKLGRLDRIVLGPAPTDIDLRAVEALRRSFPTAAVVS